MTAQQPLPFRPSVPVHVDPCVGCAELARVDGLDRCRSTVVGASVAERAVGRYFAGMVGVCAARQVPT